MAKLKKLLTPRVTMTLFALAVILLLMSSMSGTRAALTYFSEDYAGEIQMYDIGVSLLESNDGENYTSVSHRNYDRENSDWDETPEGTLLLNLLDEDEELKTGVAYPEHIAVRNSGTIPQYVRVTLYKYWLNADGSKNRTLDPDLIDLHALTGSGWEEAEDSRTEERSVYYYSGVLGPGAQSPDLTDTLTIDYEAQARVTQTRENNKIVTTYEYDDVQFVIEAQVDAVQDHNIDDAAVSAWGRRGPNG